MKRTIISAIAALGLGSGTAIAGGSLDAFEFTGVSTLVPGLEDVNVIPIFWDERCAQVEYTLDTIPPNAGTPLEIDINTVRDELQTSLDQWNAIPTSFIEMNITQVRTIGNGVRGFDFINELTFETPPGFGALASSPSVNLIRDSVLAPGDDLDGDGDSDVYDPNVEGLNVCTDIDNDGDIEFPAGFYEAGTILDNDVQFGEAILWEVNPSATGGADIQAVATHEFGHSHGLSHSFLNLISESDGTGATMFPFIDTGDPISEFGQRDLHVDDIAWSSLTYPEGSGPGPLASLQPGDVPFEDEFVVLTGTVENAGGLGIPGGNVYGRLKNGDRSIPAEAAAGTVRLVGTPAAGVFVLPPELGVVNGDFRLPMPAGNYEVFLQSPDVGGADASNISVTSIVGEIYGLHGFDEEGISPGNQEGAFEDRPGKSQTRVLRTNKSPKSADFIVNESVQLENFGDVDFGGTGAVLGQSDVIYATRYSNAEVLALLNDGASPSTALFNVTAFDASQVARFKRISLTLGSLNGDGTIATIDLNNPLRSMSDFAAQDGDLSPFYFNGANGLGNSLRNAIDDDPSLDVFVVLEAFNDVELGASGLPPLLAIDVDGPFGESFLSINGGPFEVQTTRNWAMQLNFTP